MTSVLTLSSYGLGDGVGARYPPVQEFVRELDGQLSRAGRPGVSLDAHHARDARQHAEHLRRLPTAPDLIYACGSSLLEVAARELADRNATSVPIVYWGSHIQDGGVLVNPRPQAATVRGVELVMPLYHSHRHFRLLKRFFPALERVHCMFSMCSAFIRGERRQRYERALAEDDGAGPWIPSDSPLAAFPGLSRLGEIIDVAVFEHPCGDPDRAARAVRAIGGTPEHQAGAVRAILVSCLDCLYIDGAFEQMARAAHASGVPFVGINFGAFSPQHGPVLSFEIDLQEVARVAARLGRDLLAAGRAAAPPAPAVFDRFLLRLCPGLAEGWGIHVSERDRAWVEKSFGPVVGTACQEAL